MAKKSFKDNPALGFISAAQGVQEAKETQDVQQDPKTESAPKPQKPYRINLKLRPEYRQYLDDESWKARISITEYINNLIQADMDVKRRK